MFSRKSDASKVAFVTLVQQLAHWGFALIDCQIHSLHLESLGAKTIDRKIFTELLDQHCDKPGRPGSWMTGLWKTEPPIPPQSADEH
jgi:leucyl/phenylalanyl-tRNA--protein transferase